MELSMAPIEAPPVPESAFQKFVKDFASSPKNMIYVIVVFLAFVAALYITKTYIPLITGKAVGTTGVTNRRVTIKQIESDDETDDEFSDSSDGEDEELPAVRSPPTGRVGGTGSGTGGESSEELETLRSEMKSLKGAMSTLVSMMIELKSGSVAAPTTVAPALTVGVTTEMAEIVEDV